MASNPADDSSRGPALRTQVLKKILADVQAALGERVTKAVITTQDGTPVNGVGQGDERVAYTHVQAVIAHSLSHSR
jgi:hypothetical protein